MAEGTFFCRHGQPFSMFSKVDQTGTLSWLTDKTQQFRIIDRCWRLMSHKTAYVGKRLCCCCCRTNEWSLKPSWLSGEFWQATLSFASNSLIVIFYILGIPLQDIMLISLTDRFPDLFPFRKRIGVCNSTSSNILYSPLHSLYVYYMRKSCFLACLCK